MPTSEAGGFVDIHSHVLYGLDDGAKTREESLDMLALAARSGTTDIVATPHANTRFTFQPDVIAGQIAELSAETAVRIHRGCDFHLQVDNIQDALVHPAKYSINGNGYLMVEFSDLSVPRSASDDTLTRLLDAGMVPIITHPERNVHLRQRLDDLARWVAQGCFLQVTAGSYLGVFGRPAKGAAQALMERGLTHFVASDAHDCKFRSPSLQGAYGLLANTWGEDRIRPLFVDNPAAVIAGKPVEFEFPAGAPRVKRWYQFWT